MPLMARTGLVLLALLAATTELSSFDQPLDPRSLSEAIDIGQSRFDNERSRFHALYRLRVARAPIDYIEVVTPFRRVALEAEVHTRAGQRLFGQREALAALGTDPSRVDIVVELTFHPLNTFVGVPNYTVVLQPTKEGPALLPQRTDRVPRFGQRLSGTSSLPYPYSANTAAPAGSQPMLGGSLVTAFDGQALEARGSYWVVVSDGRTELARAQLNFAALR